MKNTAFRAAIVAALAAFCSLASAPRAAAQCPALAVPQAPFAHETVTVSTVAVTLTAATYAPTGQVRASYAYVTVEAQPLRWWEDGTVPTSTDGHAAIDTNAFYICGMTAMKNFQAIRSGGTDAKIRVTYFRPGN